MAVVTIDPGPPLSVGNPEMLFDHAMTESGPVELVGPFGPGRFYDIAPEGQRFLMVSSQASGETGAALRPQINVVQNWFSELQARVPTGRGASAFFCRSVPPMSP